jgi:hypothetical protein
MAGSNAKKRLEANRGRLRALALAAGTTTLVFLAVRLFLRKTTATTQGTYGGLAATLLVHLASYAVVAGAAAPTYDARGGLVDGGMDLARTPLPNRSAAVGLDLLYLTCLVQIFAALSPLGFWLYALVPAYAFYCVLAPAMAYATGKKKRLTARDFVTDEMREKEARAERRREKRAARRM